MDAKDLYFLLMALIGVLALGGMLVIITLLVLWRRYNQRQNRPAPRTRAAHPDPWHEAGQRFVVPAARDGGGAADELPDAGAADESSGDAADPDFPDDDSFSSDEPDDDKR